MPDTGTFWKDSPAAAQDFIGKFITEEETGQLFGFFERLEAIVGADGLAGETLFAFKPSVAFGETGVRRLRVFAACTEGFHQDGCASRTKDTIHFSNHSADFLLPGFGIPADSMAEAPALNGEIGAG